MNKCPSFDQGIHLYSNKDIGFNLIDLKNSFYDYSSQIQKNTFDDILNTPSKHIKEVEQYMISIE